MASEYDRLRSDVGAPVTALDDTEAADIYAEAGDTYTTAAAIKAYTRVIAIQRILGSSTRLTDYKQNNSSESLSDVAKALERYLDRWEARLASAKADELRGTGGAARFGPVRRKPARLQEWPDEGWTVTNAKP